MVLPFDRDNDPYMGTWRQRAYAKGRIWDLGPQVLRTFDAEVSAGVEPKLAYLQAVGSWEVERPPPKYCRDHYNFLLKAGWGKKHNK